MGRLSWIVWVDPVYTKVLRRRRQEDESQKGRCDGRGKSLSDVGP